MSVTRDGRRTDGAEHLIPQREVFADDIADTPAHGDATHRGLGLKTSMVSSIDPAVNQLSERAH